MAEGIEQALKKQSAWLLHQQERENELRNREPGADGEEYEDMLQEHEEMVREQRARYLTLLPGATSELLTDAIVCYLYFDTRSEEEELDAWARRTWEKGSYYPVNRCEDTTPEAFFLGAEEEDREIPASWQPLMQEGETRWSIRRNAAAAGFINEMDYLEWRSDSAAGEPS